ncbi:PEPxxWA-CTERM sorting domain-containing protein [Sphingomonas pituitosa]|uniref:PEPxxWA-CTERM sorting domain-containing protein n=1 Tax=Sphingomonas pituitosa TaxID=99597 RepID=UPI00083491FE|nr:PEPxxWA-CTERM sorting domain-containing protein [Sphingomonas pituitosa]
MNYRFLSGAAMLLAVACTSPAIAADFYLFNDSPTGSTKLTVNGGTSIAAFQTGWFDSNGSHYNAWTNYFTGSLTNWGTTTEYRSFFSFFPIGPVTSASLTIGNALATGYGNDMGRPLELTLYDVTSSIVGLQQYNGAKGIFDDLGSGIVLGKITVNGAAAGYTIDLNQAGVDAINAAYYGVGPFTVGARLTASAVPEPAAWTLMLGGFGLMGGALRARRRRTTVRYA